MLVRCLLSALIPVVAIEEGERINNQNTNNLPSKKNFFTCWRGSRRCARVFTQRYVYFSRVAAGDWLLLYNVRGGGRVLLVDVWMETERMLLVSKRVLDVIPRRCFDMTQFFAKTSVLY